MKVYDRVINTCNTPQRHIIPADKRWYRSYAMAKILTTQLKSLHLNYPEPKK